MGEKTTTQFAEFTAQPASQGEDTIRWNHFKTYTLIAAVLSLFFCELLCLVGGGFLAPNVAAVIGGSQEAAWPSLSIILFTVALGAIIPQASDYWGRKWFIIVPNIFGFAGCIISARATSMGMYIAGFCVGGIGFGSQGLFLAVVSEVLPRELRSWAQAGANFVNASGSIVALSLGGYLVTTGPDGFRNYLYITAGIYGLAVVLVAILYNPPPRELQINLTFDEKIRALDWIGYVLLTCGSVGFCLGLSWAYNPYPWRNAHVLGPFLTGSFVLILLGIYSWKLKRDGIFHHDLFKHRNYVISLFALSVEGLTYAGAGVFFTGSLSVAQAGKMSAYRQALCYMGGFCAFAATAPLTGLYIARTKTVRPTGILTFIMLIIFDACMASVTATTAEANFWGYIIFFGVGLGLAFVTFFTTAQLATAPQLIAVTTGLGAAIRSLGGAVGLAIFNALASSGFQSNVVSKVSAAVTPLGLPQGTIGPLISALGGPNTTSALDLPGVREDMISAAQLGIKQARLVGFQHVFICAACFAFVAMIVTAFLEDPKAEFNSQIDAPLDNPTLRDDQESKAKVARHS